VSSLRAAAVLLAFAASFLVVFAAPRCTRDRVTDEAVWLEAMARARDAGMITRGDVVLIHPPWREDVVAAAGAAGVLPPGARATAALAPRHGEPLPPLVLVMDAGLPLPRALRRRIDATRRTASGGVEIVRLRADDGADGDGEGDGSIDLASSLSQARVEVRLPGREPVPCRFSPIAQRHLCEGLPEWMFVGEQEHQVGGRRERCVWAHPVTGGEVAVRWERPTLLSGLSLSLALTDAAADNRAGAAVKAELRLGGRPIGEVTREPGRRGFAHKTFAVGSEAAPAEGALELVLSTPDDGQRHTCFRLTTFSSTSAPTGPARAP
jgi:hypothetical protein